MQCFQKSLWKFIDALNKSGHNLFFVLKGYVVSNIFNQIPYTCRIRGLTADGWSRGVGAFVSPKHILTAWHVLEGYLGNSVLIGKMAFREWIKQDIETNSVVFDSKIDVALLTLDKPFSSSYLRVANEFDPKDSVELASPDYWFRKKSKGRLLKPNYGLRPDENGIRYKSDFEYAARPRSGMSGSPVINSKGEIISLHTGKDSQTQLIRRFLPPIGNCMGPTPQKLFEFYNNHRHLIEGSLTNSR